MIVSDRVHVKSRRYLYKYVDDVGCVNGQGHEIAVHSITHKGPEEWWGKNATIEDWFDEMVGQANIINRYSTYTTCV